MKKNVVIFILAIGLVIAIVFGLYKDTEANRQEALAVANAAEAMKQREKAEMAMRMAEEQKRLEETNITLVSQALQDCLKKK